MTVTACSSGGAEQRTAASTPTPTPESQPPWPEGWDTEICYALDQLQDSNGHMVAAIDGGQAFDFEGAADEAKKSETDAKEAVEAVDAAGKWKPGDAVAQGMRSAGANMQRAANLLRLGAQELDVATISEANEYAKGGQQEPVRSCSQGHGLA